MDKLMKLIKDMMWALAIGIMIVGLAILTSMAYERLFGKDLGSVIVSGEYHATTTAKMSGVLAKAAEFNQLIKTAEYSSVTLGSVVVASTTAHAMNIYNATSTAGLANGDATFITRLSSSTPRGTYTYDIALDEGLVVQLQAGYTGDYVITYR